MPLTLRFAQPLAGCLSLFIVFPVAAAKLPSNAPVPEILRIAQADKDGGTKASGEIDLPESAPKPEEAPETSPELPEADAPVPDEKPAPEEAPEEAPKPEFRPDKPDPEAEQKEKEDGARQSTPSPTDPRSAEKPDPSGKLPADELACRGRLRDLGVTFHDAEARNDASGCSMPYPVVIESLGKDFAITPDAEMNCATAETTALFTREVISPAAQTVFGTPLKSISHASAYVCRPRNGSSKLSEHAFGNALDIAAFILADGTTIAVEPSPPEKHGAFLDKVRSAACGPFKTVLGPGSNADHAEHLHFDLAPRRNGGTVCE